MTATDVSLCSQACMLLGAGEISSFDDETDRAKICRSIYPLLRDGILSKGSWNFAKGKIELTRDAADPINEWAYSFIVPGSVLAAAPDAVFYNASDRMASSGFEIFGRRLYTNQARVWVDAIGAPPENAWPAYFQQVMVYAIAAEIAFAITDQQSTATAWHQKAYGLPSEGGLGGALGDALTIDAQGSANIGFENNVFVDIRGGGWGTAVDFTWPGV